MTHTGVISATIEFTQAIDVFWLNDPDNDPNGIQIGSATPFKMLSTSNKRASIDQNQTVTIVNQTAFSEFTRFMITSSGFSWRLTSQKLRVQAVKFPVDNNIKFDKRVDLKGMFSMRGHSK